MDALIFKRV